MTKEVENQASSNQTQSAEGTASDQNNINNPEQEGSDEILQAGLNEVEENAHRDQVPVGLKESADFIKKREADLNPNRTPLTFKQQLQLCGHIEFFKFALHLVELSLEREVAINILIMEYGDILFGKPDETAPPSGVQLTAYLAGTTVAMATGILATLEALGLKNKSQKLKFIDDLFHKVTEGTDSVAFTVTMLSTLVLSIIFGADPRNNALQYVLFGLFVPFTIIVGISAAYKAHHMKHNPTLGNRLAKTIVDCALVFFLIETAEKIIESRGIELLETAQELFQQNENTTKAIMDSLQLAVAGTFAVIGNKLNHHSMAAKAFHGVGTFACILAFVINMTFIMQAGLKTVFAPAFITGQAVKMPILFLAIVVKMVHMMQDYLKTGYQPIPQNDNIVERELERSVEESNTIKQVPNVSPDEVYTSSIQPAQ